MPDAICKVLVSLKPSIVSLPSPVLYTNRTFFPLFLMESLPPCALIVTLSKELEMKSLFSLVIISGTGNSIGLPFPSTSLEEEKPKSPFSSIVPSPTVNKILVPSTPTESTFPDKI